MKRMVTIGGGTGQYTLLSGLKTIPDLTLTAVVTTADSGGSSGALRSERGVLPPGDALRCLLALATADDDIIRLFGDRFTAGGWLGGHTLGNLALTAGAEHHGGDFLAGIRTLERVLAVRGRVLPVTQSRVELCGERVDGSVIRGEHRFTEWTGENDPPALVRVWLEPDAEPVSEVLEAIADAHAIVVGPGSLFTSIIPNFLVRGMPEAIRASTAQLIYVVNAMTDRHETCDFTAIEFVCAFEEYAHREADVVVCNTKLPPADVLERYLRDGARDVLPPLLDRREDHDAPCTWGHRRIVPFPLLADGPLARHDSVKLAHVIRALI